MVTYSKKPKVILKRNPEEPLHGNMINIQSPTKTASTEVVAKLSVRRYED